MIPLPFEESLELPVVASIVYLVASCLCQTVADLYFGVHAKICSHTTHCILVTRPEKNNTQISPSFCHTKVGWYRFSTLSKFKKSRKSSKTLTKSVMNLFHQVTALWPQYRLTQFWLLRLRSAPRNVLSGCSSLMIQVRMMHLLTPRRPHPSTHKGESDWQRAKLILFFLKDQLTGSEPVLYEMVTLT